MKKTTVLPAPLSEKEKMLMESLYNNYYNEMLNKAKKYIHDTEIAHDIVINSIETAVRRNSKVSINNIKSYLYVIIAHQAMRLGSQRKYTIYPGIGLDGSNEPGTTIWAHHSKYTADNDYRLRELESAVKKCISNMPPNQSRLFSLVVEEEKSLKEIAVLTNKTTGQIKANWWVVKMKIYRSVF